MRYLLRVAIVTVLLLQGWHAWRLSAYDSELQEGIYVYEEEEDYATALDRLGKAIEARPASAKGWVYQGDAAVYRYRYPDDARKGWTPEQAEGILRVAWAGYAGAVLRCPLDSWSWSGLADVALRYAMWQDRDRVVDLSEFEGPERNTVDPARAIALAAARLAVRIQPSGYPELDVLARIHESLGDVDLAHETYVESARMMPAPSFHTWGSRRRMPLGLYEAILEGLEEGVAAAPEFERTMLHIEIGVFARMHRDLDTALRHLRAAKGSAPDPYWTFRASWELAQALEDHEELPEAIEELKIAQSTLFAKAAVNRKLGMLEARAGRDRDACASLSAALLDGPSDANLRITTAQVCERAGEIDTAEIVLRVGQWRPTDDLRLSRLLLEFYRRIGRTRTADSLLRTWIQDFPDQGEFREWAEESVAPLAPGQVRGGDGEEDEGEDL